MKHKLTLLAIAAASVMMFALPSIASAAEYSVDPETGGFPLNFTTSGGTAQLTVGFGTVHCTGNSGSGKYTTATTGDIELTFTGCTQFGNPCTTSGQASGVITTTELVFHNSMLEATGSPKPYANGTPGVLITSNGGHFATFNCSSGGVTVTGNGIIGDLSSPTCTETAFTSTATLNFTSSSTGNQTWKQVETTGTTYDLTGDSGFLSQTASEDAEGTVNFERPSRITCP